MKTVGSYVLAVSVSFGILGCDPRICEELAKNNPGVYQTPYCSAYAPDGAGGTPSFGGSGTGGSLTSGGSEASAGSAGIAGEASSGGSNAEGGAYASGGTESGGSGGSDPNGTALGGDASGGAEPGSGGSESLGGSASGGLSGVESSGGTESSGGSSGEGSGGTESSGGSTSAPCIPSGQQCSDQSVCCLQGDVCDSGFCQNPSQGQGGGGSGGGSATGGISSGGVDGNNGGTSGGGAGGVAGAAGSSTATNPLIVEYLGSSPNLGTVSCGVWTGADPRDPDDPLNTLPGYGTYRLTNVSSTDIKDFWLFFHVIPFYPNGMSSRYPGHTDAFNYFWSVDLELSNMSRHSSTGLDGARAISAFPDRGESRSHFTDGLVPTIVIPANSSVEMRITSTLCPRVRWIPDPGTAERYIPDIGTQVSMCIYQYRVGSFLDYVRGNACFDNVRTYGGT